MQTYNRVPRSQREVGIALGAMGITLLLAALTGTMAAIVPVLGLVALGVGWVMTKLVDITNPVPVDIWEAQQELMVASGQSMPSTPHITDTSVLYAALVMEELSETVSEMHSVLARQPNRTPSPQRIAMRLHDLHLLLLAESQQLRKELAKEQSFAYPMSRREAVGTLDGVTDIAVVTAGMGLACGLPVRAGYVEVAESNLSKRNPDTMVIDKDRSGKWIKGINYQPPNLVAVVSAAWPADPAPGEQVR